MDKLLTERRKRKKTI